jgi:hypothetical protein
MFERKGVRKMDIKKLASVAVAGALMMSVAGVAFAAKDKPKKDGGVTVENKGEATQETTVSASANTGRNDLNAWNGGEVEVKGWTGTGDAVAVTESYVVANEFDTVFKSKEAKVKNDGKAKQTTKVSAMSNTGNNDLNAWKGGEVEVKGWTGTGNATASSWSSVWANIFTTIVK